jgi:hypothetical protein
MDLAERVHQALSHDPAIDAVRLVGSRARREPTPLSDWDFEIATTSFPSVAAALPSLVRPLRPIAQQWDRLSRRQTYMLVLAGPEKVDLLFDKPHQPEDPWTVTPRTLPAIDDHFWDWTLWLLSKQAAGRVDVVGAELGKLFMHLLRPMGARKPPTDLATAVEAYVDLRATQERIHGLLVPRALEHQVRIAFRPRLS